MRAVFRGGLKRWVKKLPFGAELGNPQPPTERDFLEYLSVAQELSRAQTVANTIKVPGMLPSDYWEIDIRYWRFDGVPLYSLKAFGLYWAKVKVVGECWLWQGAKSRGGQTYSQDRSKKSEYGNFKARGKTWKVHRLAYIMLRGPLTTRDTLDHLLIDDEAGPCTSTLCINPWHMEKVTRRENTEKQNQRARAKSKFDLDREQSRK